MSFLKFIKWLLMSVMLVTFTACGGGSSNNNTTPPTDQQIAIAKIMKYAETGTPVPTVKDYEDAGVTGVTADNIDKVNAKVAELTPEEVNTAKKIRVIVYILGITLPPLGDNTPPVITLTGTTPIDVVQGSTYTDAGATATDNVDGDITGNIVTVNPVDTSIVGPYTVTYNVSDVAGNPAIEVTRTVNVVAADNTPPTLAEVTPVPTPTNDTTPSYTFSSDEAGSITYGGSCTSATTAATAGNNIITFNTLSDGTYSDCTITVTDAASNASTPLAVTTFEVNTTVPAPVSALSAGDTHTVEIRNGELWAYGLNNNGQLGSGDNTDSNIPVRVGSDTDWVSVSVGGDSQETSPHNIHHQNGHVSGYTLAIKSNGTLWAWGDSTYGQLGTANNEDNNTDPVQVGSNTNWVSVSTGDHHAVAIRSDGTLWAWGENNHGQLGNNSTTDSNTPIQIAAGAGFHWVGASAGGGDYLDAIPENQNLSGHTVAIKVENANTSNRTLWAWGYNSHGQLGTGNTAESHVPVQVGTDADWESVSAGESHTVAIKTNGKLYAWGYNYYRQLGVYAFTDILSPAIEDTQATDWSSVSAGSWHTAAIKDNGTLWTCGRNDYGEKGDGTLALAIGFAQESTLATTWTSVSAGALHTVAIQGGNTLFTWGDNYFGQLGNGTQTNKYVATQESTEATDWNSTVGGGKHTIAIKAGGTLWAWGYNLRGQLGDDTSTGKSVPTQEGTNATNWSSITAGYEYSAAINDLGELYTWGHNDYGQDGNGTTGGQIEIPTQVGLDTNWTSVASGGWHTAAIQTGGTLLTWGRNHYGQLGNGTTTDTNTPAAVTAGAGFHWDSVSVSDNHTVAIKVEDADDTNRTLWAWGWNVDGQLGTGDMVDHHVPVQVGTDSDWASVSASDTHTVALKSNGELWSWGSNIYGQVGLGTPGNPDPDTQLIPVRIGNEYWLMASTGDAHTVAIRADATLWTWGDNEWGQLGIGYRQGETPEAQQVHEVGGLYSNNWVSVDGGDLHNIAINNLGQMFEWGHNEYGQVHAFVTVPTQPQP